MNKSATRDLCTRSLMGRPAILHTMNCVVEQETFSFFAAIRNWVRIQPKVIDVLGCSIRRKSHNSRNTLQQYDLFKAKIWRFKQKLNKLSIIRKKWIYSNYLEIRHYRSTKSGCQTNPQGNFTTQQSTTAMCCRKTLNCLLMPTINAKSG